MKKRTRCMYTKEKAIKIWQLCNFDKMTQAQASKIVGCNKGAANRWFNLVKDTPALLAEAKKGGKGKSRKIKDEAPIKKINELDSLRDENEFLQWWNKGERQGWVDLLLKRME